MKKSGTFTSFLKLAKPFWWIYVIMLVVSVMLILLDLAFAENSRVLFDLIPDIVQSDAVRIVGIFIVVAVAQIILNLVHPLLFSYLNESVVYAMRQQLLTRLQHLPLKYYDENHSSKIHNLYFDQLERAKDFVVGRVQDIIRLPLTFILIGGYLFQVHYLLGITAFVSSALQVASSRAFKTRLQKIQGIETENFENLYHTMGEMAQGIREIKANQLEQLIDERLDNNRRIGIWSAFTRTKLQTIRENLRILPTKVGYVLGIIFGIYLMSINEIGAGDLVAFIMLADRMNGPFNSIVHIVGSWQETMARSKDLFAVMEEPYEEYSCGETLDKVNLLTFDNVSFAYNSEMGEVLEDISFEVKNGATVALIGPSGGGKSTLVKLLYRFYEPQSGSILMNRKNLNEYSINSIRSNIAIVSQDIFIFDGTIYDNIVMGRNNITKADVDEALEVSQAWEFINKLPEGIETKVGERGIRLSQGQKQRLAIARAIVKKANVLILDEPTASLDVDTEAAFQTALSALVGERIKIIIAHRLTTIKNADYIIFLDNGRIVEQGTQDELLSLNGRFKDYRDKSMV